jgi:hypothetical protein
VGGHQADNIASEDDYYLLKRRRAPEFCLSGSPGPDTVMQYIVPSVQIPPLDHHLLPTPPNSHPESGIKPSPTISAQMAVQIHAEGHEIVPREVNETGEKKMALNGAPLDGREYLCRTFYLPNRGDHLFMLATECARILNYPNSSSLFNTNPALYAIVLTQSDKDHLIQTEILSDLDRSRQITVVTARSMFRQFGSQIILNGKRVQDDYWETTARERGFTGDDLVGIGAWLHSNTNSSATSAEAGHSSTFNPVNSDEHGISGSVSNIVVAHPMLLAPNEENIPGNTQARNALPQGLSMGSTSKASEIKMNSVKSSSMSSQDRQETMNPPRHELQSHAEDSQLSGGSVREQIDNKPVDNTDYTSGAENLDCSIATSTEFGSNTDLQSLLLMDDDVFDQAGLNEILAPLKSLYVERIVSSSAVGSTVYGRTSTPSDQEGTSPSSQRGHGKRNASSDPSRESCGSHRNKKRDIRSNGCGPGDQDEDEDNSDPMQPPSNAEKKIGEDRDMFFACPFVKRYPYRYRKCYALTLKDVARVKYHLFRGKDHQLPIYCPRCSITFESEENRDEHIRETTCVQKPPIQWEGISSAQRAKLKQRSLTTKSAEANWYSVYRILFPDAPLPSSPYIDMSLSGELRSFREHHLCDGPGIWREILAEQLPDHLQPFRDEILSLQETFFPECVARLFDNWTSRVETTQSPRSDAATSRNQLSVPSSSSQVEESGSSASGKLAESATDESAPSSTHSSDCRAPNGHSDHLQLQQSTGLAWSEGNYADCNPTRIPTPPDSGVADLIPQTARMSPDALSMSLQHPFDACDFFDFNYHNAISYPEGSTDQT